MVEPQQSGGSIKKSSSSGVTLKHSANRGKSNQNSHNDNVRRIRPGIVRSPDKRTNLM